MPADDLIAAATPDDADGGVGHDLTAARAELIAAIEGAEPGRSNFPAEGSDGLAKVDGEGLSFELRLNGETIRLDGREVNDIAPDDFKSFLDRQRLAVENGDFDEAITRALATPGPGKALARVRAIGASDTDR
ncbi:hypothetical protein [Sphingomonas bacterium]|uniref:hypothetical protein n=1 Tax=Sphingomonas bacterium TaxID=1895847 RepID=UPI0015764B63|nr:hypothetical protein [Sphingomonas bacterium]